MSLEAFKSPAVKSSSLVGEVVDPRQLRELEGWWLCEDMSEEKTDNPIDVPVPVIFQFETKLCQRGYFRVIGRVFNMTIREIRVGTLDKGNVIDQIPRLYTNLKSPKEFAATDHRVHDLMETLTKVQYDKKNEALVLSNGKVNATARRSPQGKHKYRRGLADTDIVEVAIRILQGEKKS